MSYDPRDRIIPNRAWVNRSAGSIVRDIARECGLAEDVIEDGPSFDFFAARYDTAARLLDKLVEATGYTCRWDSERVSFVWEPVPQT